MPKTVNNSAYDPESIEDRETSSLDNVKLKKPLSDIKATGYM